MSKMSLSFTTGLGLKDINLTGIKKSLDDQEILPGEENHLTKKTKLNLSALFSAGAAAPGASASIFASQITDELTLPPPVPRVPRGPRSLLFGSPVATTIPLPPPVIVDPNLLQPRLDKKDDIEDYFGRDANLFDKIQGLCNGNKIKTREQLVNFLQNNGNKFKFLFIKNQQNEIILVPELNLSSEFESIHRVSPRHSFTHGQVANFEPAYSAGNTWLEFNPANNVIYLSCIDGESGHYCPAGTAPIQSALTTIVKQMGVTLDGDTKLNYFFAKPPKFSLKSESEKNRKEAGILSINGINVQMEGCYGGHT